MIFYSSPSLLLSSSSSFLSDLLSRATRLESLPNAPVHLTNSYTPRLLYSAFALFDLLSIRGKFLGSFPLTYELSTG